MKAHFLLVRELVGILPELRRLLWFTGRRQDDKQSAALAHRGRDDVVDRCKTLKAGNASRDYAVAPRHGSSCRSFLDAIAQNGRFWKKLHF